MLSAGETGAAMHALVTELYPLCRSLTGRGVRETLEILRKHLPLQVHEVPSGTRVLDWEVPPEWNVREAFVADASGRRVIDFARHNLHLVGYSEPVRARLTLAELRPHLYALPDRPDWIPYRTQYYTRGWGFCLSQRELDALADGPYDVVIDATLEPGSLSYGELLIPGESSDEILLSAHLCHPSLANDNLSGISVLTRLGHDLLALPRRRHSFRLLFAPATIGAITWLARNDAVVPRLRHGLVLSCLGDAGPRFTYKRTRRGAAAIDRAAAHALRDRAHEIQDFSPYGYDERQYNSPGYDLPVGLLMRSAWGRFPEYHTSADDLGFVRPAALAESHALIWRVLGILEGNQRYRNTQPRGEPQLGRRGLYAAVGGRASPKEIELAQLWVLNQSDGAHDLLDIAERAGMAFEVIREAADRLLGVGLLAGVES